MLATWKFGTLSRAGHGPQALLGVLTNPTPSASRVVSQTQGQQLTALLVGDMAQLPCILRHMDRGAESLTSCKFVEKMGKQKK